MLCLSPLNKQDASPHSVPIVTLQPPSNVKILLVKPLLHLMWPIGVLMTRLAMKRFKAMIESPKTA